MMFHRLNCVFSKFIYIEALTFNVIIFEGRAFRKSLSLDEAIRLELS